VEGALHEDRFVAAYYEEGECLVAAMQKNKSLFVFLRVRREEGDIGSIYILASLRKKYTNERKIIMNTPDQTVSEAALASCLRIVLPFNSPENSAEYQGQLEFPRHLPGEQVCQRAAYR
jgi:hypothetical protein